MNTLNFIITAIGTLVGIAGFVYGLIQNNQRRKLESVFRVNAQTIPGDIAKIHQSSLWAWDNVRNAHEQAIDLPDSKERTIILNRLSNAVGDTVACERLLHALFNSVINFQQSQFGTKEVIHHEKEKLPLYIDLQKSK